jgi:hypothetical protein
MLTDYVNALDHFKMEIRSQAPSDQSRFRAKGKPPVAIDIFKILTDAFFHTYFSQIKISENLFLPFPSVCRLYVQGALLNSLSLDRQGVP